MNLNAFFSYVSELSTCTHMHQPKYGQNEVTVILYNNYSCHYYFFEFGVFLTCKNLS